MMKISAKQKRAIGKISGRSWDTFSPEAIEAYFALTDRGTQLDCIGSDFYELMEYHRQHPVSIEMWKEDFRKGLLFLWDFLDTKYPKEYIKHAFEIYESVFGYIPKCYREHELNPLGE
jgi:hypothetical protein